MTIYTEGLPVGEFTGKLARKHIDRAIAALRKNRFEAEFIESPEDLLQKLSEIVPAGSSCALGGSVTLEETGVRKWLENKNDITYFDRNMPGCDVTKVQRQAFSADFYFTGTNALTQKGELYNIDGRGNRLAAICYGPAKVIVVTGYNKLVETLDEARVRMRTIAAPANTMRLSKKTPCASTGVCGDCNSDDRICSQELVTGWQMTPGRISVYILNGQYGF
jgi:L-lactate utilization protein LutB